MSDEFATKADLAEAEIRLLERLEKVETTLLKEFRKWATITEVRLRTSEVSTHGLTERVASLESRVSDLEQRKQ
jgi:hypothetical protein